MEPFLEGNLEGRVSEVDPQRGQKEITMKSEAYFRFAYRRTWDTFVIQLTEATRIEHARRIFTGQETEATRVSGVIAKQAVKYNHPWSFHLDPATIEFVVSGSDECDALIDFIEDNLSEVGVTILPDSKWCPSGSELVEEVTLREPQHRQQASINTVFLQPGEVAIRPHETPVFLRGSDVKIGGWLAVAAGIVYLVDQVAPNWIDKLTGRRQDGGYRETLSECAHSSADDLRNIVSGEIRLDRLRQLQSNLDALRATFEDYKMLVPEPDRTNYLLSVILPKVNQILSDSNSLMPEGSGVYSIASGIRLLCIQEAIRRQVSNVTQEKFQSEAGRLRDDMEDHARRIRRCLEQRFEPCQFSGMENGEYKYCYKFDGAKRCSTGVFEVLAANSCSVAKTRQYFNDLKAYQPVIEVIWAWAKESKENSFVTLQDFRGRFVSAIHGGGSFLWLVSRASAYETFEQLDLGNNCIALKAFSRQYVGRVGPAATRDEISADTIFTIEATGDGEVALKGSNGKYLWVKQRTIITPSGCTYTWESLEVDAESPNEPRARFRLETTDV